MPGVSSNRRVVWPGYMSHNIGYVNYRTWKSVEKRLSAPYPLPQVIVIVGFRELSTSHCVRTPIGRRHRHQANAHSVNAGAARQTCLLVCSGCPAANPSRICRTAHKPGSWAALPARHPAIQDIPAWSKNAPASAGKENDMTGGKLLHTSHLSAAVKVYCAL